MKLTTLKPTISTVSASRLPSSSASVQRTRGNAWMAKRKRILYRDCGLCQECKRNNRVTVATEVDHITPLHMGGTDAYSNLESLCHSCHQAKTSREAAARGRAD